MRSRVFRIQQPLYSLFTNVVIDIATAGVAVMGEANIIAIIERPTCMCHMATAMEVRGVMADITMGIILAVTTAVITLEDIMVGTINFSCTPDADCKISPCQ